MSCFIMQAEGIAALSEFTADLLNNGFDHYGFDAPNELSWALSGCRDPYCFFDPKKIYQALYALNVAAYTGHYERDFDGAGQKLDGQQAPDIKTSDYIIHNGISGRHELASWHYRIVKLLQCYNYQVAEDATMNHPLADALKKLEQALTSFIVVKSPEYEAAPGWGRFYYEEGHCKEQSAEPGQAAGPKDLICVQDVMDKALGTKDYFRIRSLVAGLPRVMDSWIHADDLVKAASETDAASTVRDIVADLPKFDLPALQERSAQAVQEAEEEQEP